MTESAQDGLRIDLMGATDRIRETFEMVFRGPGRGCCGIANSTVANAVLVDLDGVDAALHWREYRRRFPDRPAILVSVRPVETLDGEQYVAKPIRIDDLLAALTRVRERLNGKDPTGAVAAEITKETTVRLSTRPVRPVTRPADEPARLRDRSARATPEPAAGPQPKPPAEDYSDVCGTGPDIDPSDPVQIRAVQLPVADRLLGVVQNSWATAKAAAQPMLIALPEGEILLDPAAGRVTSSLDEQALKAVSRRLLRPGEARVSSASHDDGMTGAHEHGHEAFLWKLALWTYRGRLPEATRLQERVYLKHWPNLTRLLEVPDAMRICALWSAQAMPLVETAAALHMPQRQVFALYAAAHVLGLAGQAKRAADHLFQTHAAPPSRDRPLVARVLARLRGLVSRED